MIFNAVLFIAVMVISGIFLYMSYTLKRDANKKVTYEGEYHIEIAGDFAGEDISIFINDSLLNKESMSMKQYPYLANAKLRKTQSVMLQQRVS